LKLKKGVPKVGQKVLKPGNCPGITWKRKNLPNPKIGGKNLSSGIKENSSLVVPIP